MENKYYLKKFNSQNDYETQKDSIMETPHVVLFEDTNKVVFALEKETLSDPFNGYDYVDLGLPSGTLWATKPITNENDEVLYFQWGDTEGWTKTQLENGEKYFSSGDYKWMYGLTMPKYNATDGKTVLDLEDDAAHFHMGGDWHMPTVEQFEELIANTTSTWTTQNGVNGRLFTASNGKSVFIPIFGYMAEGVNHASGTAGRVWSSVVSEEMLYSAWALEFLKLGVSMTSHDFTHGLVVFGVIGD